MSARRWWERGDSARLADVRAGHLAGRETPAELHAALDPDGPVDLAAHFEADLPTDPDERQAALAAAERAVEAYEEAEMAHG